MKLELREQCWKCDGNGWVYESSASMKHIHCDICNGRGYHLTQEGEEIKIFIEDHFHLTFDSLNKHIKK